MSARVWNAHWFAIGLLAAWRRMRHYPVAFLLFVSAACADVYVYYWEPDSTADGGHWVYRGCLRTREASGRIFAETVAAADAILEPDRQRPGFVPPATPTPAPSPRPTPRPRMPNPTPRPFPTPLPT